MISFTIYVEPHERQDAIEAYSSRLSAEQIEAIRDADDDARIQIDIRNREATVTVL